MGRLGRLELAAGSLAIGFTNITGYSVLSGLAMGMEPLCSQAVGSGDPARARRTLHQTILMLFIASVPIGFLWVNLEPLMLILGQDRDITKVASVYCRFALPDLVANSLLHPLRIYFRSNEMTWQLMWCTFTASVVHIPMTWFLSFFLHLGVPGIAISNVVTNFNTVFILLSYLLCRKVSPEMEETIPDLLTPLVISSSVIADTAMKDWKVLLKMAIPSCLGVCLEWWWYEFMTLLAGYLPNPTTALATAAIVIQTTSLMYTIPSALSASVSTRVGNELGAGQPSSARLAAIVSIGLAILSPVLGLVGTTLGREPWGRVFTNDKDILELTMSVLPIIGLCELANCPQTTSCGVLRGSARPETGAGINFVSFYLVGAPVAVALGFGWDMGFVGLCYGLLAAQVTCAVSILMVVYGTDWVREGMKAKGLVVESEGGEEQVNAIATKLCEEV